MRKLVEVRLFWPHQEKGDMSGHLGLDGETPAASTWGAVRDPAPRIWEATHSSQEEKLPTPRPLYNISISLNILRLGNTNCL